MEQYLSLSQSLNTQPLDPGVSGNGENLGNVIALDTLKFEPHNFELDDLANELRVISAKPGFDSKFAIGIIYPNLRGDHDEADINDASFNDPESRYHDRALALSPRIVNAHNFFGIPILNRHSTNQKLGELLGVRVIGNNLYGVMKLDKANGLAMNYYKDILSGQVGCSIRYTPAIRGKRMYDAHIEDVSLTHHPKYRGAKLTIAASEDAIMSGMSIIIYVSYFYYKVYYLEVLCVVL
jgi:hypothetical protein